MKIVLEGAKIIHSHLGRIEIETDRPIEWVSSEIYKEPLDVLEIEIMRTLSIEPLHLRYDGHRNGWSICTELYTEDETRLIERAFVPYMMVMNNPDTVEDDAETMAELEKLPVVRIKKH